MQKKLIIVIGFCFFLLMLSSCAIRIVDYTVISTKNVDLSRANRFKVGNERVLGKDIAHSVFVIPGQPNMKEAIDRAIEQVPGAVALVDGVIYRKEWAIPFIYGQISYEAEGTPLIDMDKNQSE